MIKIPTDRNVEMIKAIILKSLQVSNFTYTDFVTSRQRLCIQSIDERRSIERRSRTAFTKGVHFYWTMNWTTCLFQNERVNWTPFKKYDERQVERPFICSFTFGHYWATRIFNDFEPFHTKCVKLTFNSDQFVKKRLLLLRFLARLVDLVCQHLLKGWEASLRFSKPWASWASSRHGLQPEPH